MRVHDKQGMVDATWNDIARTAGVSLATMYRHFANNEELISECGKLTFRKLPPPDPSAAAFAGLRGVARLERLVEVVCEYYERTHPMMALVRRDLHRSGAIAEGFETIRIGIEAFMTEALQPFRVSQAQHGVVSALIDDRFWTSLVEAELDAPAARSMIVKLLRNATRS